MPFSWIAAFAGLVRLKWQTLVLVTLPGQVAVVLAVLTLGEAATEWTTPVIDFFAAYTAEATAVVAAAVALQAVFRWGRGRPPGRAGGATRRRVWSGAEGPESGLGTTTEGGPPWTSRARRSY